MPAKLARQHGDITITAHGQHSLGLIDQGLHGLMNAARRIGTVLMQNRIETLALDFRLFAMSGQSVFERGVRRSRRDLAQAFDRLSLDAGEFLQFGHIDIHVPQAFDLHAGFLLWTAVCEPAVKRLAWAILRCVVGSNHRRQMKGRH
jgi:hypothetical protein